MKIAFHVDKKQTTLIRIHHLFLNGGISKSEKLVTALSFKIFEKKCISLYWFAAQQQNQYIYAPKITSTLLKI